MLVAARQEQQQSERSNSRSRRRAATPRDYSIRSGLEAFREFFCTYLLEHVEKEPITA